MSTRREKQKLYKSLNRILARPSLQNFKIESYVPGQERERERESSSHTWRLDQPVSYPHYLENTIPAEKHVWMLYRLAKGYVDATTEIDCHSLTRTVLSQIETRNQNK